MWILYVYPLLRTDFNLQGMNNRMLALVSMWEEFIATSNSAMVYLTGRNVLHENHQNGIGMSNLSGQFTYYGIFNNCLSYISS